KSDQYRFGNAGDPKGMDRAVMRGSSKNWSRDAETELRRLRYFVAAAKELKFSRTAAGCVSRPPNPKSRFPTLAPHMPKTDQSMAAARSFGGAACVASADQTQALAVISLCRLLRLSARRR